MLLVILWIIDSELRLVFWATVLYMYKKLEFSYLDEIFDC